MSFSVINSYLTNELTFLSSPSPPRLLPDQLCCCVISEDDDYLSELKAFDDTKTG